MTRNNKYNVSSKEKRTFYGILFDSKHEMEGYIDLSEKEKRGEIKALVRQPKFVLQKGYTNAAGKKIRPIMYVADFAFREVKTNKFRVIDYKGFKTATYILKKKLFDFIMKEYDIYLEEA